MPKTPDLTGAPAPRLCAETIARSPNLASAAEKLGCSLQVLKHQFEQFRQEVVITTDARRDILLDRLEIAAAALMPAVEKGDNAAIQSLAKLTRETGILVPGLAQSSGNGQNIVVQIDWLAGSNRLSYASDDVVEATTPALKSQESASKALPEPSAAYWKAPQPTSLSAARKAGRESVEKLPDLW